MTCARCGQPLGEHDRWRLGNDVTCSFACLVAIDGLRRRRRGPLLLLDQPLDLRERAALTSLELTEQLTD